MQKMLLKKAKQYAKQNRRRSVWRKCVQAMACIVVFCTTYALILPAITLEKTWICGMEEHIHTDACYTKIDTHQSRELICTYESAGGHIHSESCKDIDNTFICGNIDFFVHSHSADCYNETDELVCQLPEIEEHIHAQDCYREVEVASHIHEDACYETSLGDLVCGIEASQGHAHTEDCYQRGDLICQLPEQEAHTHGESCSGQVLVCEVTVEPHTHSPSCYEEKTCELTEDSGHVHDETCTGTVLACDLTEEPHGHTDGCYQTNITCELPETEGHAHTAECYEWILTCELPETEGHAHTDSCREQIKNQICPIEPEIEVQQELCCEKEEIELHSHEDECYETELDAEGNEQKRLVCEKTVILEHIHGESCFVTEEMPAADVDTLTCTIVEAHVHAEDCYDENGDLTCEEVENHVHSEMCYGTWELTCGKVVHTHSDECRPQTYYCGIAEHSHEENCYDAEGNLICALAEHIHSEACLAEPVYYCGLEPHSHDEDCRDAEGNLICELAEHVHAEACLVEPVYYCGLEPHDHDEDCRDAEGNLICLLEEHAHSEACLTEPIYYCEKEEHSHDEQCLDADGNLICLLEEHIHTKECTVALEYHCGKEEHTHEEACWEENGGLICELEEHLHFALCTDPNTRIYCWVTEHTHEEACLDENGELICEQYEHTHVAECCDFIGSLVVMIDMLPTSEEAEEVLLAYEEAQDWDGYAAYKQRIGDFAWPLYYACEELDEEDLLLVTNYDHLMDLSWLWSAVTYALPAKSPYYPMDNGEWITEISENNEFYEYIHVNEVVPDEYTVDGLVVGAKLTDACEPSFEPVFTSSLAALTDEECIARTGYDWHTMDAAGLDNTYGANLILPANDAGHDALTDGKKNFVVYRNVGTYEGDIIHLIVQIVNYKPFTDDNGITHDGILGFYSNGYIGVAACGVEWVKLQYNFIEDKDIATAIEKAKAGESLTGLRRTVKGSTSFYDIDYSQAVHMHGTENTPWTKMLTGIYVTNVTGDVPDLSAVDALTSVTAKRNYFRNWPENDCVLKIGTVDHVYSSWAGPAIFSSHPYDDASEDWRTDSKHGVTMTFDHTWFYVNYSFDKGRNADGGIRHYGEPVSRGSLTIKKEVTGTNVTADKEFEFQITFHKQQSDGTYVADTALDGTYGGVTLTNGVGTFKLKDGGSITINNIPIRQHGTHYRVTELGYDGYIVETSMSSQVLNGTLQSYGPYTQDYFESSIQPDSTMAQRQIVVFENYGGPVLPNTGGAGTTSYTMGGLLLMAAAILLYTHILKRRKEEMPSF